MDKVIGKAETVKSTIKEFLELFRAKFDADVCYLYLVNTEMDEFEKKGYFIEKSKTIKEAYKKRGQELPQYLMDPYFKDDFETNKEEILKAIDILKFIDIAEKGGVKRWNITLDKRPEKYVVFKKLNNEEIIGEGLTAYMARVKYPQQFFNSHEEITKHPSSDFSNFKKDIAPQCKMLIGFPLVDENGRTIGVLKIENYTKNEPKNKNEKGCINTGEYNFNAKDSNFIAVQSYIPLLIQFIKSSEDSFKYNSYDSLFRGIGLLENLKKMNFPVLSDEVKLQDSNNKVKLPDPNNKIKFSGPNNKARHITNQEIYDDTLHLFLVLKRREFIGHEEILKRITHYVMGIGTKLGLNEEILKYFECNLNQFQKQEEYLHSGLDRYRDHFIHQFHVFVSGYIIINELGIKIFAKNIEKSMKWILSQNNKGFEKVEDEYRITDADVLRIWFLTAFYHDFAYILEELDDALANFFDKLLGYRFVVKFDWEKLLTDEKHSKHICDLLKYFSSKKGTNTDMLLQNYLNAIITYHDHGVLSALLLTYISEDIPYRNINECFYAALAISLHNTKAINGLREGECINKAESNGISFESFPIAFLLAFCDTAQSFGRLETKKGEKVDYYPSKFFGIDIVENEKVTYKIAYDRKGKIPDDKIIKDWANRSNKIFRSFEYSFVIEYYETNEEDEKPDVEKLICALSF